MKRKKCISCNSYIYKSARNNPYVCRSCELQIKKMDTDFPIYFKEH